MLAQLIPIEGGKPITLKRDVIVVGRKPGLCDLIVERPSVSKLHCVLVKTDGLLFVRDLGSTNGTKVNGQRVTRGALLPGDELAFASVRFRVNLGPDPQEVGHEEATEVLTRFPGATEREDEDDEPQFAVEDDEPAFAPNPPGDMGGDDTSDSDVRLYEDDSR